MLASTTTHVLVLAVGHPDNNLDRRIHVGYPHVAKILLVESTARELGVSAFRSTAPQSGFRAAFEARDRISERTRNSASL